MKNIEEQALFTAAIDNLKEYAKVNGNILSRKDILDSFKGLELEEGQLQLIYGYLKTNKINIADIEIKENEFEKIIDESIRKQTQDNDEAIQNESNSIDDITKKRQEDNEYDNKYLDMYLEDLKEASLLDIEEENKIIADMLSGNDTQIDKLIESYLIKIIGWIDEYRGRGIFAVDLIQESNLVLMTELNNIEHICGKTANTKIFENHVRDKIAEVILKNIEEQKGSEMISRKVLNKVNAVNDAVSELYKELERKLTVQEVAEHMGISVEAVREAIDLSSNKIEHLEIQQQ